MATTEGHPVIPGAEPWSYAPDDARTGVVVSHGYTGNPNATRPLGEALAEEGFAVEVIRLPGHGTSWRDLARLRYPDLRVAVDRAYAELATRVDRVVLVGHSVGGTLALDVAAGRCRTGTADALAGVVTINGWVLDRDDALAKVAPLIPYLTPVLPRALAGAATDDAARPGVSEHAYRLLPTWTTHSIIRELPRVRRVLADVTVPVLVAVSREDHVVPPANSHAIVDLLGSEDVTLLELENSYHLAALDHDADLLARETADFVERVTATGRDAGAVGTSGS